MFGIERLAGINDDDSATGAVVGLVLLLGAFGYVAARRGQSSWGRSLLEGLVVALIGVGVLVLKLFLKESHRPYR
ncbi:MAG TPA: hypothetical protein VNC14_08005 [Lapillicoccus sp.]|nr:hypothetical protein [Lapillicoccus sp.]